MNSQYIDKYIGKQWHASEVIRMAQENWIANYKALAEHLGKSTFLVFKVFKYQASKISENIIKTDDCL